MRPSFRAEHCTRLGIAQRDLETPQSYVSHLERRPRGACPEHQIELLKLEDTGTWKPLRFTARATAPSHLEICARRSMCGLPESCDTCASRRWPSKTLKTWLRLQTKRPPCPCRAKTI